MWQLIVQSPTTKRFSFDINTANISIGRRDDNDVVLEHSSASRQHAQIRWDEKTETLTLEDLNSTNGTYVNGKLLHGSGQTITHNDQIRIGQFLISIIDKSRIQTSHVEHPSSHSETDSSMELMIQAVDQFAVLMHDLSNQLITTSNHQDAAELLTNFVIQMTNAEECRCYHPGQIEDFIRQFDQNVPIQEVIEQKVPIIFKHTVNGSQELKESHLVVPVLVNSEIVALLHAKTVGADQFFTEHDLQLVVAASHQAALVHQRLKYEEELIYNATHDPVTGLPNRQMLLDHLHRSLARAKRDPSYSFALFFMDLDDFKLINDSLGHLVGDEMLKAIAKRLHSTFRELDTVTRYGGDEFAIIYDGVEDVNEVIVVAQKLIDQMAAPFHISGKDLVVKVSLGATVSTLGYDSPEDIIRDADIAMYQAKELEDIHLKIYDQSMHQKMVTLLHLQNKLRQAFSEDKFFLRYQPIIALQTGKVVGLEALIRWNSDDQGIMTPDQFLPSMDTTGLLSSVEGWVMKTATSQIAWLNDKLDLEPSLSIAINLSEKQIRQPNLFATIEECIQDNNLSPSQLWLEITEQSNITNMSLATEIFTQIRQLGLTLCLDDFGTGYSTLSYLYTFPLDILKIDRSFVHRVIEHEESAKVVRTVIGLAKNLGLRVVAEGVETKEQFEFLRNTECDYVQGFYFSKPLDIADILTLMLKNPQW